MKSAKRIITIVLAICLTFSVVPAVSAAEEIKNPAISFDDWDAYVEEMRRKNYGADTDALPEGYDQSVIDAINNNIDNSISVSDDNSSDSSIQMTADAQAGLSAGDVASTQNTTSDSTSTAVAESFTVDPVADPFNLAAGAGDSVSLATGALTYEKTLLSLPGRNGHDLNISVRYNSDSAVITQSAYSKENQDQNKNFNQFAIGWSFGFPYISIEEYYGYKMEPTLNLAYGGSYRIDLTEESGLKYYKLDDMTIKKVILDKTTLEETTIEETHQDNRVYAYVLTYADGKKEYFNLKYGNIIKSSDRFGNTITFIYEDIECYQNSFWDFMFRFNSTTQKRHVLSKIIDSTGKEIVFSYDTGTNNFEKYIKSISIKMDGNIYAHISLKHEKSYNGKIDVVDKIIDAENYAVTFVYDERIAHSTYTGTNYIASYNPAGSGFLMTEIVLPTGGTVSYEYEKARRNYTHELYTSTMYYGTFIDWREVFKVSERTDSGGNKSWYRYENDRSGYPDESLCINEATGYVSGENFLYYTTVTKGQTSTLYTFNHKHQKIAEESYSAISGVKQLTSNAPTTHSVVINNKVYTVTLENEFLSAYTYDEDDTQPNFSYHEKAFQPIRIEYSYYTTEKEPVYLMGVKSYGGNIYAFVSILGVELRVYKFNPADDSLSWNLECTFSPGYTVGGINQIIRYNESNQKFYLFRYNYIDGGTNRVYVFEYDPATKTMTPYYKSLNKTSTQNEYFICMDGNTAYFAKGTKIYQCIINESISITSKDFDIAATYGFTTGSGTSLKTYFVSEGTVYEFDYSAETAVPVSGLINVESITTGTDGKLYFTTIIDTDSSETGELNRQVLMSYDVSVEGSTPEIEYYCFSDTDEYTLLTTYGGMYLKTNARFEIAENTASKQTRIRVDYTYNEDDQMTGYRKSVTEGASISHQGGESYEYVDGQNAILTHTDILGNRTEYCYGGECTCENHNEALSTYYIPLKTTQYANREGDKIVTTNVLSDDKKKIVTSTTAYDNATYVTQNTYDDTNEDGYPGNIIKTVVAETDSNTKISETDYTYDTNGNFVISQTSNDIVTNTNQFGNRQSIDLTTKFEYNDFGQVTHETKVVGADDGKSDENDDVITTYEYNKNGWQTKVTYPDGIFVATDYDIGNTNKVTTNYNNEYSTADYFDSMGRATKQTKKQAGGTEKTIAQYSYYLGRIESVSDGTKADYYTYDNFDRVAKVTHGNPIGISYYSQVTYDDLNLKSTVTLSNYKTTTTHYDIAGRVIKEELGTSEKSVTTYTYDYMGNVKTVTDPNGNITTHNYNDRGQLTSVVNALNQITAYEYDIFGNASKVTTPGKSELQYEYDNAGRLLTTTNAVNASEHYAYDTLGNLIAQKDRKGQVTNYTYDNMNRPLSKSTGTLSVTYEYDNPLGNLTKMTDGTGTTEYDYTYDGMLSGITTPDNKSIAYSYNDAGYMTGVTDYSGYNYTYTYSGTGDMTGITQKQNGTTVSSISMFYNYPGVFNGWMLRHAETGDSDRYYFYDDKGRVTKVDCGMFDFVGNTTSYVRQNYVYDAVGNITQKTATTDGTTSYTYDVLNRIASETAGTTLTAYSYDANNNIVQKVMQPYVGPATIKSYTYDGANRMTKETVTFADDITETTFGYDANGNMLYKLCNNSAKEYAYDAWNRLTEYTSASGVETTYTYNGDNRRTSKTTGNTTINYYWDRDHVSTETSGADTNVNFITPFGIASRIANEDYTFIIRDRHGDVIETFTNGVRDTYSYDAFGNEKTPDTNDDNPLRYCGEYYDTESGLIYLRNRYYDPDMGRFINEDPIQDGLNWYAYCGNNPVMFVDPTGESLEDVLYGIAVAIDQNNFGGIIEWAAEKIVGNSGYAKESDYDYYLGKVIGDVISIAIGAGVTVGGVMEIINSIAAGSAITVGSGGTLTAGGLSISAAGVASGTATATIGAKTILLSSSNLSNDYDKLQTLGTTEYKKSVSGSGKEKATDVPSWAKGNRPYKSEDGKAFATRLMDGKYGKGNWKTTSQEFSKIKKWGDRGFK